MSQEPHVLNLASDYVLDLLSASERSRVESHLASCLDCRHAVRRERRIGLQVRSALHRATQPDGARLRALMPPVTVGGHFPLAISWQKQLATVSLLMLVLLGSVGLWQMRGDDSSGVASPTLMLVTATTGEWATATVASTGVPSMGSAGSHVVATLPMESAPAATPFPAIVPEDTPVSDPIAR